MKLIVLLGFIAATLSHAFGQEGTTVRPQFENRIIRIYIKHADPWAVKALIEGTPINSPELSTLLGFAGVPDRDSDLITSIFGGKGKLIVNPTDNSLIFVPAKG